jgi:hemoglobin-like flavoprotein
MNPDQIQIVRGAWPVVAAGADTLASRFYARLFEIDQGAARLFGHVDMDAQRKKLIQTLAVVVASLDDPDRLLNAVGALGKRHVHYGVEDHHFDTVGEALIDALHQVLGDGFTPEVQRAWLEAYTLIASVMRRALVRASLPEQVAEQLTQEAPGSPALTRTS